MEAEQIWALANAVWRDVVKDRRYLHQHPELSFEEANTARYVAERLSELGLQPETGIGGHGIRVVIQGGRPGSTIALRADMDALPISEETGLPFASTKPGVMHACGHDAHTAMLLGAARALVQMREQVAGRVVLIFQPGEELNPGGASLMIRDGVLTDIEAIFGLHIAPFVPCGHVHLGAGPMLAAPDELEIVVRGRGGHAAYPHQAVDPIPAAAQVVGALQHVVSRNVPPCLPAVVTIGSIHGGKAHNVIPHEVRMTGTIRTMDAELRRQVPMWVERAAKGAAAAHGCEAEVRIDWGYPVLVNDAAMTAFARRACETVLPPQRLGEMEPGMGGEDFAFYLEHVPGTFVRLGVADPDDPERFGLHSPRLKVDERAFVTGVAYWLALAVEAGHGLQG